MNKFANLLVVQPMYDVHEYQHQSESFTGIVKHILIHDGIGPMITLNVFFNLVKLLVTH